MAEFRILFVPLASLEARLRSSAARARTKLREYFDFLVLAYFNWRVRRIIARTVRDTNAPCPACGHRNGEIRWVGPFKRADGKSGALLHQCKVCKAAWGEPPIVNYDDWKIDLDGQEAETAFQEQAPRA